MLRARMASPPAVVASRPTLPLLTAAIGLSLPRETTIAPFVGRPRLRRLLTAARLDHDWERMATLYRFPRAHWKHLRATRVIELPFAVKRCERVANATAVIWKNLDDRREPLPAPECAAPAGQGRGGSNLRGWRTGKESDRRGRRVSLFTHAS